MSDTLPDDEKLAEQREEPKQYTEREIAIKTIYELMRSKYRDEYCVVGPMVAGLYDEVEPNDSRVVDRPTQEDVVVRIYELRELADLLEDCVLPLVDEAGD